MWALKLRLPGPTRWPNVQAPACSDIRSTSTLGGSAYATHAYVCVDIRCDASLKRKPRTLKLKRSIHTVFFGTMPERVDPSLSGRAGSAELSIDCVVRRNA